MTPRDVDRLLDAIMALGERMAKLEGIVETAALAAQQAEDSARGRIRDHEKRIRALEQAEARSGRFTAGDMVRMGASIAGGLAAAVVVIEGMILGFKHL